MKGEKNLLYCVMIRDPGNQPQLGKSCQLTDQNKEAGAQPQGSDALEDYKIIYLGPIVTSFCSEKYH